MTANVPSCTWSSPMLKTLHVIGKLMKRLMITSWLPEVYTAASLHGVSFSTGHKLPQGSFFCWSLKMGQPKIAGPELTGAYQSTCAMLMPCLGSEHHCLQETCPIAPCSMTIAIAGQLARLHGRSDAMLAVSGWNRCNSAVRSHGSLRTPPSPDDHGCQTIPLAWLLSG